MIIEVVVEVISITLYSVIFYRYYTKRRLMKSMDMRDKARSDLYLAQLRSQSAPNTPGFGPLSPSFASVYGPKSPGAYSQQALSPRFPPAAYGSLGNIDETHNAPPNPFTPGGRAAEPQSGFAATADARGAPKPFKLQAPPFKAPSATRKPGLSPVEPSPIETFPPQQQRRPEVPAITVAAAADEPVYDTVPIPGAYAGQAVKSPPAAQTSFDFR